ncbi:low-density lipoprotein receptor class A domain-containing protein 2 [Varanus komodoensis]|uniref:low-density lipoprotein receptor class A domain-containing protein 2 n=1 Tax=Varanus komodoensis TaxID=61221 RepID=UPI001CF7BE6C|nr:low-density lipoprotein receptor class A domain-containing protein 2 [Varanus komodoensis]
MPGAAFRCPSRPMAPRGLVLLALPRKQLNGPVHCAASLVDFCGQTLQGDGVILTSHRDSRRFYFVATGTDCQLTLQAASPRDKVQFQFRFFLVYSLLRVPPSGAPGAGKSPQPPGSPWPPGQREATGLCTAGPYVRFYDGEDRSGTPLGTALCGTNIPRPVRSTGSRLTLRLVTRGQQPRVDFVGDFTSLRTGLNASACRAESYFPCRNGACIPPGLVCDGSGVDNCGDGTDQAAQPPARCKGPTTPVLPPSAASVLPTQASCARSRDGRLLPPGGSARDDAARWKPLLVSLAALVGAAVLYWCCRNPGWLLWRAGACRRRPGHSPAGHLCTCCRGHRALAKVTPQGSPEPPV